ncbi:MAG: nicotinamide-nucleotide amidohydrolase family protein, partial [Actinobacteria bacterium]|nr:nicotinamide-nucleotide amidohydrolase family protein [Actinomycetota bacterium]
MQTAAIITIGTELVEGLRADTNGPAIARELSKLGFDVQKVISVGDDKIILSEVFKDVCAHYDLVVSTGGLGPTHDDVTRDAASLALGLDLYENENVKQSLQFYARRYGDSAIVSEIYSQALVLEGAMLLDAIAGTAPGQVASTPAGKLLLLPGPPKECMPLLAEFTKTLPNEQAHNVDFSIFGLTETEVQHTVQPLLTDYPEIGFTVLASPVEVHAILFGGAKGGLALAQAADALREALGEYIFSEEGVSLAQCVLDLANQAGLTIGTAESCTGGLAVGALTEIPGSSKVVKGGIVSYSNDVKETQLGVSGEILSAWGAVSSQVASEMASGARDRLDVDIAIAITGIAGPDGGTPDKPVGTVWFGLATKDGVRTVMRLRGGTRGAIRLQSVSTAL